MRRRPTTADNRPSRRRRLSQAGQTIPIIALLFVLLAAMAGLAIDSGHNYFDRRQAQNASDAAVLAAGQQLAANGTTLSGPPSPTTNANLLLAAHDFAANNGFTTVFNHTCDDSSTPHGFTTTWFDASGPACSATQGYVTKITFNDPPCGVPVSGTAPFSFSTSNNCKNLDSLQGIPGDCTAHPYNCMQVVISTRTTNFIMGLIGQTYTYTTTAAAAYAQPPTGNPAFPTPSALYLYEKQDLTSCPSGQQCFNEANTPSRTLLSCSTAVSATNNCPTLWTTQSNTSIYGIDAKTLIPPQTDSTPVVQSNGDVWLGKDTAFCDPYGGATCQNNQAVGAEGLSINPEATNGHEANMYCAGVSGGGSTNSLIPCTNKPGTGHFQGNEASWVTPTTYQVTYTQCASGTTDDGCTGPGAQNDCGALILNGEAVGSQLAQEGLNSVCKPAAGDEYTIEPGMYKYIVINHGQYFFDSGSYYITGTAPVDTNTGGPGTYANGIDHGNETTPNDWDLCNGGQPNSCGTLTAGVWIGHGKLAHYDPGTGSGSSCSGGGGATGTQAGGGDQTIISASATTFVLGPNAGGFVSTAEVNSLQLVGPGPGNNPDIGVQGASGNPPVAIDMQNGSFIHLDAKAGQQNGVTGIVYQDPTVTSGGVEVDPGMNNGHASPAAAISGQVLAYSFTSFGHPGEAVNFQSGYGTGTIPQISNSGHQESSIVTSASLTKDQTGTNGVFTLQYTDEWALDAYDSYISVGGGTAQFFSQGMWGTATPTTSPEVPNSHSGGPSDSTSPLQVQRPVGWNANNVTSVATNNTGSPAGSYDHYTVKLDPVTNESTDYSLQLPFPAGGTATFETSGNWTWGHEKDLGGATIGNPNVATVTYTFPLSTFGSNITISMGLYDGDHCGDYALYTGTFSNPGTPGGGGQTNGTVKLEQ